MKNLIKCSWGILLIVVAIALLGIGFYKALSRRPDNNVPCGVADVYGTQTPAQPQVTCPDARQKLTIERTGTLIGFYEYRCHCE